MSRSDRADLPMAEYNLRSTAIEAYDLRMDHQPVDGQAGPTCLMCESSFPCEVRVCIDNLIGFMEVEITRCRMAARHGEAASAPAPVGLLPAAA